MTLRGGPHAVANEIAVSHMSGIKDVLLPLLPFRAGGLSAGSRQPRLAVIGAALGLGRLFETFDGSQGESTLPPRLPLGRSSVVYGVHADDLDAEPG